MNNTELKNDTIRQIVHTHTGMIMLWSRKIEDRDFWSFICVHGEQFSIEMKL